MILRMISCFWLHDSENSSGSSWWWKTTFFLSRNIFCKRYIDSIFGWHFLSNIKKKNLATSCKNLKFSQYTLTFWLWVDAYWPLSLWIYMSERKCRSAQPRFWSPSSAFGHLFWWIFISPLAFFRNFYVNRKYKNDGWNLADQGHFLLTSELAA